MGIVEKIKEIEAEMARTQKNKATEFHLGQMKARIAKLRTQLLEPKGGSGGAGEGFEVTKYGHGRVALIGFPSVGKSTLLTMLTGTRSEAASYEFTTLTCIPGIIHYNDTKIQLLDLPGIIEGASEGKGRGRQVIAVSKSSDIVLMVLDASKSEGHRQILTRELEAVGLRLNKRPPQIYFKKKKTGGISFNSTLHLTHINEKLCYQILHEYKIHNAEVLFREDATVDEFIDVIEGNRKYMKCIYVYNKIDVVGIDDVDRLSRQPNSIVISCNMKVMTHDDSVLSLTIPTPHPIPPFGVFVAIVTTVATLNVKFYGMGDFGSDTDDEDLQNLADEEMNRSHQSVQDEDLSIFDSEEDLYRDNGVKEEEDLMHDDSYIDKQYIAGPVEVMSFGSVQTTFAFYKEHSRLTSFGVVKKSAKTLAGQIKTWLTAMDEIPPTVILTDKSESIKAAIHEVLPNTIHRCESMHAFFNGYISGRRSLKQFVEQYGVAFRFKYEKELEKQASKRKQLVQPTIVFDWDMQIHGHYTHAIYDFFRVQLQGYYIVKLKGISISIRWMKLRHKDLKNVLKACFKKYMVWEDDMVFPNIPDLDFNTDAIIVKNLRKVRSHGRPQINKNKSSRQYAFRRDARR
ncbi:hypothetical protein BC332_30892 [Capsicum chinense]|nr:hypothetical protein BC332_30892 [Capsicum chinense]